mgnify:CR=1 FL=1
MDLIDNWASKALELAAEGTEAKARALLARANIEPVGATEDVLVEATALAEALDSLELRSFALGAKTQAAFDQRRFRGAIVAELTGAAIEREAILHASAGGLERMAVPA